MYDDLLRIEPTGLSLEAGRLLVSTPYFPAAAAHGV